MATGQASPKVGKVIDIPANAPTIGTATDLAQTGKVSVPFTAGSTATGGPVFSYTAVSNPGSIVGTGTSSPITVSGLTDGTAYTFTVAGTNATGNGPSSAASNSATPTVTPTSFESIATYTGSGNPTSITFSSIPQTYKHLQIRSAARNLSATSTGVAMYVTVNGSANSSMHRMWGDGSTATSEGFDSGGSGGNGYINWGQAGGGVASNIYGVSIIDVSDYTSTTKTKTFRIISGTDQNSPGRIYLNSFAWLTTNAITSITIIDPQNAGFATNSSFALYGIKG